MSRRIALVAIARWLAPSGAAACGAGVAAGLVEALGASGAIALAAAAGFVALAAVPIAFAASVIVRLVVRAWAPAEVAARLTDERGSAPRLAARIACVGLAIALVAWLVYEATYLLARYTSFNPIGVELLEPIAYVGAGAIALVVAAPALRGLEALFAALDRRVALTPKRIVVATVALGALGLGAAWLHVRGQIGPLDTSPIYGPLAGALAAIAIHAAWGRLGRARAWGGGALAVAAAICCAAALFASARRPALVLEIWGERPIAGMVIDSAFDLDAIRERVPMNSFRPTAIPGAPHPDIVLITIDAVRADHTPPYGGTADMPTLRDLAARGATFEWAFAPSNVTRRSIPSMVIGLQPNRVRGRVVGWALKVDPRHVLLAERFRAAGYDTAGFMCCDSFWGPSSHTGLSRGLTTVETEHNGPALAKLARAWLAARGKDPQRKPLFFWMHILEPHNWTANGAEPKEEGPKKRMYDASLAAADRMLAEVLAGFEGQMAPVVVVTADHGEGLGEHGHPYHSTDLYASQTRVPMVVEGPGVLRGLRVAETVSTIGLAPTLLALAGFAPPAGNDMDGASFADLAGGRRKPDPDGGVAFSAMIRDRSNPGGLTAIARGKWHLIRHGSTVELYDVRADPGELHDVSAQEPQVVAELRALLAAREAAADVSPFAEAR